MKTGYFIMALSRDGRLGILYMFKISDQPEEGFLSRDEAVTHMKKLHNEGDWNDSKMTIMELFWED